jgi:hypothetical protein
MTGFPTRSFNKTKRGGFPAGLNLKPAYVQRVIASNLAASPSVVTLSNVTAGNQLIVVHIVTGASQQAVTGVTGGEASGHNWAKLGSTIAGGFNYQDCEIWWLNKAAGGTSQVSVAYSGNNYSIGAGAWLAEFRKLTSADGAATVASGTSTAPAVTTAVPSQTGNLALAVCVVSNDSLGPSATPASPWVDDSGPLLYSNPTMPLAFQFVSNSLTRTATWAQSASLAWAAMAVLLKTH